MDSTIIPTIYKAKVYIKNPSEAPQGSKVERGKRGGHYYESTSMQEGEIKPNEIELTDWISGNKEKIKFEDEFTSNNIRYLVHNDKYKVNDKETGQWVIYPTSENNELGEIKIGYPLNGTSYLFSMNIGKRGRGIGTEVWKNIEKFLISKDVKRIEGYVEFSNDQAYNFWMKQGFKVEKETGQGWKIYKDLEFEPESNIEIIVGDIKDKNILDSLETFAEEGKIEALPPPTREEVQRLVDISGIDKNIKVVSVPYWSETVNAWTYMGDDVIYLMSNNAGLDKEVLEETRNECFKAGYDITNMTLENRKIGTLIHEESHIKTYKKAGITITSEKDFERLHYTFREYEKYIMKHFEKDKGTIFDSEVLLELIAEDGRINHRGRGNEFPHRYFYINDIKNPQFKEGRANILRKMGMI